jgi:hypothetical protein
VPWRCGRVWMGMIAAVHARKCTDQHIADEERA